MKKSHWLDLCAWMAQLWPNDPIQPATAAAWWPFVADLDVQQVREAIGVLRLDPTQRFAPTPGELRQTVQQPDPLGWTADLLRVTEALNDHDGTWRDTAGPIAAAFIDVCGGISQARRNLDASHPATRAQFRDFWQAHTTATRTHHARTITAGALKQLPAGHQP